jgi:hypothetical protein
VHPGFCVGEGTEGGVEAVEFEWGEAFLREALGDGLRELFWWVLVVVLLWQDVWSGDWELRGAGLLSLYIPSVNCGVSCDAP